MDLINIDNTYVIVSFLEDDTKDYYWLVPLTSIQKYWDLVENWIAKGEVQGIAGHRCVVFNGEGDVPLEVSNDPLCEKKCAQCRRRPDFRLHEAVVLFGPGENMCCVLSDYETRARRKYKESLSVSNVSNNCAGLTAQSSLNSSQDPLQCPPNEMLECVCHGDQNTFLESQDDTERDYHFHYCPLSSNATLYEELS